ncbi:MAG TPA: AAA family ATPase [Candidatus Aminicenantes bacterium]|nr:AAA family ATPase [Candidatus Aminicenantes bacterium]
MSEKKRTAKAKPAAPAIEINPGFRRALDVMEGTSRHVFITGKAGTGKSTLLEYWRGRTGKRVAVLAPTGVAALNVRGQTIHSFFGFKPDVTPEAVRKLPKARGAGADRAAIYRNLDAIVIDEVSMVRADLMDCVEKFLRLNGPGPGAPFGGLQMILIGDLYQLPPVVTGQERGLFAPDPPSLRRGFGPRAGPAADGLSAARYESPYFFSARVFAEPGFDLDLIELEKVYRQSDAAFIALLNAIRNRSIDDGQIARLNSRLDPAFEPPDGAFTITLTSTNDLAAARNREKLASLRGRVRRYQGFVEGEFDRRSFPTEETLELKPGAQVMLLVNDRSGRFVNGTIGRVSAITAVPNDDDVVTVELPDGGEVDLAPFTWELFRFRYDAKADRIESETAGSFTQYPVRLAWAVTIHKSQGKTFDRVVIDIGRGAFAHGQVYVALSRCTSFEGLVLKTPIKRGHIWMDWRIVRFLTRFQYRKAEEALPLAEKRDLLRRAVRDGLELEIVYLKPDDTKSRRRVRPEAVETMEYRGKRFEGLRAYCHARGECRTFRLDRILEII